MKHRTLFLLILCALPACSRSSLPLDKAILGHWSGTAGLYIGPKKLVWVDPAKEDRASDEYELTRVNEGDQVVRMTFPKSRFSNEWELKVAPDKKSFTLTFLSYGDALPGIESQKWTYVDGKQEP